jgi:thiol-disulfide isomerase/thioredoxin
MIYEIKNKDELNEILEQCDDFFIVAMIGGSWCRNCTKIKPFYEKLSNDNEDMIFLFADASDGDFDVNAVPTFSSYWKGKLVRSFQGGNEELLSELVGEKYTK